VSDIERMREYVINRWGRVTPNRMGVAAAALGLPIEVCPYENERRSKPGFKDGYNWEKHLNMRWACPHGLFAQSCEQCQIATLRAELAEARRDAERYRWLRRRNELTVADDPRGPFVIDLLDDDTIHHMTGEEIDAAIDAARGEP